MGLHDEQKPLSSDLSLKAQESLSVAGKESRVFFKFKSPHKVSWNTVFI